MRYGWLLFPFLITGCSSLRYVTTDHGHIVDQNNQRVNIVGNPPVACHLTGFNKEYEGYFMYQNDDGTIFIDDYGRGTIELQGDVTCRFLRDTN